MPTAVTTLTAPTAMAAANGRLFVSDGNTVAVLDTTTLAEAGRWATSPCPVHLAFAGTRLFYGFGCPTNGTPGLGSVDATAGTGPYQAPTSTTSPT
nr:hypothetical protein Ade03nite_00040 [Actinoplanes derwentensis]